ncbi:metallophosphoesterase family protein [Alteromonas pelagimontana]|uniref:Metallophosphoesterase family protein n=1 Tax=Alteromonas pelagimontana TaxID=1858656 RepID=A0A6M4MGH6_9ALTE|nr:metallophosphoesterase [Alteromonas pelagimontana]QJR81705.1 metallophosphoesterase family protein [Alteromonas pelagimontana]
MKVLHATDLHFNKNACEWLTVNQACADVVCLTGDFLDTRIDAAEPPELQVLFFLKWFQSFSRPLLVCSGNHDVSYREGSWLNNEGVKDVYGDGAKVRLNGITFGCVPYVGNLDVYRECDVLLHHEPPARSKTAVQDGIDYGCTSLSYALTHKTLLAKYVLCGHVHRPSKSAVRKGNCIVINAGGTHSQTQASHALIEVDEK